MIDLMNSNKSVSLCKLTLFESIADSTGTDIGIGSTDCINTLSELIVLNNLSPFDEKTSTQTMPSISSPVPSQNINLTVTESQLLDYLFDANW